NHSRSSLPRGRGHHRRGRASTTGEAPTRAWPLSAAAEIDRPARAHGPTADEDREQRRAGKSDPWVEIADIDANALRVVNVAAQAARSEDHRRHRHSRLRT